MSEPLTYAIGDVHGHVDKLRELHEWIAKDQERNNCTGKIVHVGDLVDRGPDSAGSVEYLLAGVNEGKPWIVLKGNHDRMMSFFLETPSRIDFKLRADLTWQHPRLGGDTTLASYGVDVEHHIEAGTLHQAAIAAVPKSHVEFLAGLETMYQASGAVFVHAGILPGVALEDQIEDDLTWIRGPFHEYTKSHGALIVHGHTPIDDVTHYGNRVNIDTGVAYGGPMSAIAVQDGEVWQIGPDGRSKIDPID